VETGFIMSFRCATVYLLLSLRAPSKHRSTESVYDQTAYSSATYSHNR